MDKLLQLTVGGKNSESHTNNFKKCYDKKILIDLVKNYKKTPGANLLLALILNKTNSEFIDKNINNQDKHGNTALHYAVKNSLDDIAIELIKHGIKTDIKNNEGFYVKILIPEEYQKRCERDDEEHEQNENSILSIVNDHSTNLLNKLGYDVNDDKTSPQQGSYYFDFSATSVTNINEHDKYINSNNKERNRLIELINPKNENEKSEEEEIFGKSEQVMKGGELKNMLEFSVNDNLFNNFEENNKTGGKPTPKYNFGNLDFLDMTGGVFDKQLKKDISDIHNKVIELVKDTLQNEGVTTEQALLIKKHLARRVLDTKPELKNMEKAREFEKIATTKAIKDAWKIIDEIKKDYEEYIERIKADPKTPYKNIDGTKKPKKDKKDKKDKKVKKDKK